jgi:hypothetical protein
MTDLLYTNINDTNFINNGWFAKDSFLKKRLTKLHQCNPTCNTNIKTCNMENKPTLHKSCCLTCFELTTYDDIKYSKIINFNKQHNIYNIYCVCKQCYDLIQNNRLAIKKAPHTYKDVIDEYINNDKIDLFAEEFKVFGLAKMHKLNEVINYQKYNYNEKLIILNALKNENTLLSNNIDIEVEKHRVLVDQLYNNDLILNKMKTQFQIYTEEIVKTTTKTMSDHLEKLNEIASVKKYSTPECKICMANEVRVALQCGHLLCHGCHKGLSDNIDKSQYESLIEDDDIENMDIIECPVCRSISPYSIKIYF